MYTYLLVLLSSVFPMYSEPSFGYPETGEEEILLRCPHSDPDLPALSFQHQSKALDMRSIIHENSQYSTLDDLCHPSARRISSRWTGDISDVPFQVSLRVKQTPVSYFSKCGGSLITLKYVLTAAHCLVNTSHPLSAWRIVAGTNKGSGSEGDIHLESWRNVLCYFAHKNYLWKSLRHDLAVVEAEKPFELTDKVQPIRIHTSDLRFRVEPEMRCLISGYGASNVPGSNDNLRVACIPILSYRKCNEYYPSHAIPPNTVCAGSESSGTCYGDSGGPLICRGALVGVLSGGFDCEKLPGVFMRVLSYTKLKGTVPLKSSHGKDKKVISMHDVHAKSCKRTESWFLLVVIIFEMYLI